MCWKILRAPMIVLGLASLLWAAPAAPNPAPPDAAKPAKGPLDGRQAARESFLRSLTPEQRDLFLKSLPPERRQNVQRRWQKMGIIPSAPGSKNEAGSARGEKLRERLKNLPPEARRGIRERLGQLPPEQRGEAVRGFLQRRGGGGSRGMGMGPRQGPGMNRQGGGPGMGRNWMPGVPPWQGDQRWQGAPRRQGAPSRQGRQPWNDGPAPRFGPEGRPGGHGPLFNPRQQRDRNNLQSAPRGPWGDGYAPRGRPAPQEPGLARPNRGPRNPNFAPPGARRGRYLRQWEESL